jgi:hypothetical protein
MALPERTGDTTRHLRSLPAIGEPPVPAPTVNGGSDELRTRALDRVCAGFKTTISARSAARLADLLDCGEPGRAAA